MSKKDKKKKDLTKISDLNEFFHEEDPDLDLQFDLTTSEEEGDDLNNKEIDADETETEDELEFSSFEASEDETPLEDESFDATEFSREDSNDEEAFSFDLPQEDSPPEFIEGVEEESEDQLEDEPFSFQEDKEPPLATEPEDQNLILEEENQEQEEKFPHVFESKRIKTSPPPINTIKSHLDSLRFASTQKEANPAFSVLIENIQYIEDSQEVHATLEELGLISEETKDLLSSSLKEGRVLVSHISEFTAITLLNKIRNLELSFKMGLSHQIHESKNYLNNSKGLISRNNLKQNKTREQNFQIRPETARNVLSSTTPTIESCLIQDYHKLLTASRTVTNEQLFFQEEYSSETNQIYQSLISDLKEKAFEIGANAIVGILFQTIPNQNQATYQILCSGNAVTVTKNHD